MGVKDLPAWPATRRGPMFKTPRAAARAALHRRRRDRRTAETDHKAVARRRDGQRCRWPLCGCKRIGLRLEVSHDRHKGAGGDPTGARSKPEVLITFCFHRHQDGIVSRHKQTLRVRYLTPKKNAGPVAFEVKRSALARLGLELPAGDWLEVARERAVQNLEPLEPWQLAALRRLGEMDL